MDFLWGFSWDSCGDFIGIFMGCNQIFMGWDLNGILVDIVGKMVSYCFSFGYCVFFESWPLWECTFFHAVITLIIILVIILVII